MGVQGVAKSRVGNNMQLQLPQGKRGGIKEGGEGYGVRCYVGYREQEGYTRVLSTAATSTASVSTASSTAAFQS